MRHRSKSPPAWSRVGPLILILASPAGAQPIPPPVENLSCTCDEDPDQPGALRAVLTWTNPEIVSRFTVEVRRDGVVVGTVPGRAATDEVFLDRGLLPGTHTYEVTVVVNLQRSAARTCTVNCSPIGNRLPTAAIV